ncbi:MAG TPA: metallophosphoesterase [Thermoanaerobaculia bacterium]|nr:metallophosphoesterase [Thermoanaerobaculia bacterium]
MTVFFAVFLSIWVGVNAYVFWRAASVPFVARVPRWAYVTLAVLLASSYVLARVLYRFAPAVLVTPLEWLGANWMGVVFLAFFGLLAVDVGTGFGLFFKERIPALRTGALLVAVALSVVAVLQALRPPVVREHEVRLKGLPPDRDGTTLVLLSDLHLGTLLGKAWLAARVEQVAALKPDLVVLCGDVLEGDSVREGDFGPVLARFAAPLGKYAVTGNHEYYAGIEESVRILRGAGFTVLRDQAVEVRPGLVLAGVDDLTARRQFGKDGAPLQTALAGRPPGATILLSHSPRKAEVAGRDGVGLMPPGHTHAGQIWPFGHFTRMQYPLLEGRYEVGGLTVIVCRGTGTWGPRMRLFRPSELLRVTLRPG